MGTKDVEIDMVLVDALCLPPHETAVPVKVAKIFSYVSLLKTCENQIPIVDFSWAVQCIVQRKRLNMDREQYRLSAENSGRLVENNKLKIFSFKKKETRYEVGDTVFFQKKNLTPTAGRILSIFHDINTKEKTLEVQLMEFGEGYVLMDGGKNSSLLTIDEKDFKEVSCGWVTKSEISCFMKRKHH